MNIQAAEMQRQQTPKPLPFLRYCSDLEAQVFRFPHASRTVMIATKVEVIETEFSYFQRPSTKAKRMDNERSEMRDICYKDEWFIPYL